MKKCVQSISEMLLTGEMMKCPKKKIVSVNSSTINPAQSGLGQNPVRSAANSVTHGTAPLEQRFRYFALFST